MFRWHWSQLLQSAGDQFNWSSTPAENLDSQNKQTSQVCELKLHLINEQTSGIVKLVQDETDVYLLEEEKNLIAL